MLVAKLCSSSAHHIFRRSTCLMPHSQRVLRLRQTFDNNFVKSAASQYSTNQDHERIVDQNGYKLFYRYDKITFARLISRMKLYQTGLCLAASPTMAYFSSVGLIPWANTYATLGIATFACCVLFAMSEYLRRLVGIMSLNRELNKVKVSHLTFWGGRNDLYLDIEDVVPLSELPDDIGKEALVKFKRYSSDSYLYVTFRYGTISHKDDFEYVFGKSDFISK